MADTQYASTTESHRSSMPYQQGSTEINPRQDLLEYLKEYGRQRPEVAALWCFGIGFILGWKLKPW